MKLSLFSASALLVAVSLTACGSSSSPDAPPGPVTFEAEPQSNDGAEVFFRGRTEGDRVFVDVVARGVKEIHGTAFRVKWDPESLALVSATPSETWSEQALVLSKEPMPGMLVVAWSEKGEGGGHEASEAVVLGTLVFDAKSRKGTAITFRAERSAIVDHEGKTLPVQWRAGNVPAR